MDTYGFFMNNHGDLEIIHESSIDIFEYSFLIFTFDGQDFAVFSTKFWHFVGDLWKCRGDLRELPGYVKVTFKIITDDFEHVFHIFDRSKIHPGVIWDILLDIWLKPDAVGLLKFGASNEPNL